MNELVVIFLSFGLGFLYNWLINLHERKKTKNLFELFLSGLSLMILTLYFYQKYHFSYRFFPGFIISSLLILIFTSDLKYLIIFDSPLLISALAMFGLNCLFFDLSGALKSCFSGIIIFLFMLFIAKISSKLFKRETLGGGDIKFSYLIGCILPLNLAFTTLALSTFLALPASVFSLLMHKEKEVAYGPFLVSALLIVYMFSDKFQNLLNFLFSWL